MKVFMSWSGQTSKAVAELLATWAKCVVQATQPWISTSGIDRGAVWFSTISEELNTTSVGVICLTHENKNKPWILFEAGALAKGLVNSRVCTFLIDLAPQDLESPLSQFNHTSHDREGLMSLAVTLNASVGTPLPANILEQVFNSHWDWFHATFNEILTAHPQAEPPQPRTQDSILNELLENSRSINTRLRAVEERTFSGPRPAKRIATVSELPQKKDWAGRKMNEDEVLSSGIAIANEAMRAGVGMHGVHNRLIQAGFSQQGIDAVLRHVDQAIHDEMTQLNNSTSDSAGS
jgi:hypothetical protein